jgi:divinyl protochlorophyllide a 8-vinyl-reductase
MPELPVVRMHQALRSSWPSAAPGIEARAGERTAEYLLAHRIPALVQRLLRALPSALAAALLSRAIARNAWTFCGSGAFGFRSWPRPQFEIADNPLVRGETSTTPLCIWHQSVFLTLFSRLCGEGWEVRETQCGAQGATCCRFELSRLNKAKGG